METYLPLGSLIRILPLYCSSPEELCLRNGRGRDKSNPPQLAGKADRVQHTISSSIEKKVFLLDDYCRL